MAGGLASAETWSYTGPGVSTARHPLGPGVEPIDAPRLPASPPVDEIVVHTPPVEVRAGYSLPRNQDQRCPLALAVTSSFWFRGSPQRARSSTNARVSPSGATDPCPF